MPDLEFSLFSRYCATDPDNNLDEGISGADVVKESLRRICIWKHYGKDNGMGEEWWNYAGVFMEKCDNPVFFMDEKCVREVYNLAGIDGKVIDRCMSDSGGLEGDVRNQLLEDEIAAKVTSGVVIIPAVFVNGAVIRGALTFKTVFQAVCAGYLAGTAPEVCAKCVTCPEEFECTVDGYCKSKQTGVSNGVFIGTMVGMAVLFGALLIIQYRKSKGQMRDQVRGIIAEYMPLDEDLDGKDTQIT